MQPVFGTIVMAVALAFGTDLCSAELFSSEGTSKTGLPKSQIKLLDGRLAKQYEDSKRLLPTDTHLPRYSGGYTGEFRAMADEAAALFGVPKDLFARLVHQESNWNPRALSPAGAIGLAQLMPDTARKLGVDPYDPKANLEGGALYLKQQYMRFRSWKLAIAAYNAGPEAVKNYGDVPPYTETQNYVRVVLGN
ncbi:MAG: lytic transglycosylase domain-containing protein [Rhodobacterales bacterium]